MMKKVFYYKGEEGEDFFPTVRVLKPLPENYSYISHNPIEKAFFELIYRIIGKPFAYFCSKVIFRQTFKGKRELKKLKGGYFIYCNHTLSLGDAVIPNTLSFWKKNYIIVGKETSSLTFLRPLLRGVGAIPLFQTYRQGKDMLEAMKKIVEKSTITIFPEAHIWPLYNKIRDFPPASLVYPYMFKVPVISIVNCYTKRRFSDKPKITTVINGPYYFDYSLNKKESIAKLHSQMLNDMKNTAEKYSTYSYHEYIKI